MSTNGLTLGLTSIGDLLLKSSIRDTERGDGINGINLLIPDYQRPYKWKIRNANQLLDDIMEAMNDNKDVYRVGTLILHHKDTNNYDIVDGQQRTVTFALLLMCLTTDDIPFLQQKMIGNVNNINNVSQNYRSLQRRIDKLDKDTRKHLQDYIIEQCEMIVVITNDLSEAFQFFDSQNARGKALYPHDLLKAYHLREMNDTSATETEEIVERWENMDQWKLSVLFSDYLYRLKQWARDNRAYVLNESNIDIFKGVTARDNHPYAQYYKGAYAYTSEMNRSNISFVTGMQKLNPFQIDAPIIAGKAFFEYAKHYFYVLQDIQNNDKYEGYIINDNEIVKTLDLRQNRNGIGNRITRLLFDTAILLYVDRFCPGKPSKAELDYLEQFVVYAFAWAYSMRAQYTNVSWAVAQNYVLGEVNKADVINGFNIYKCIAEAHSPSVLLSRLAELVQPLKSKKISERKKKDMDDQDNNKVFLNYLHFFVAHHFWEEE